MMIKRIISFVLVVSIICGIIPAVYAHDELNISVAQTAPEYDILLPEELPQIGAGNGEVFEHTFEDNTIINPAASALPLAVSEEPQVLTYEIDGGSTVELDERLLKPDEQTAGNNTRAGEAAAISNHLGNINSRDTFALSNQTGRTGFVGDTIGSEYIDPLTGNLIVTETDLVLPGVDGLDLNISRYYSLAQAELYTKEAGVSYNTKTITAPAGSYIVTETAHNIDTNEITTYKYVYLNESEAKARYDEIRARNMPDNPYIYNADYQHVTTPTEVTVNYYYTSHISSSTYTTMRSNLGAGWSWSFPSVQVVKNDYTDAAEIPSAIYYHDGTGNVFNVERDYNNNCTFTNYVGKDMTFELAGFNMSGSSARIDYEVRKADGRVYSFGPHGELRVISDRFNNTITFNYASKDFYGAEDMPVISNITDSVGRVVSFSYTQDAEHAYVTLTITSPVESEEAITLTYTKKMLDMISGNTSLSSEPVLESYTDANGYITQYFPASIDGVRSYVQQVTFTFADKTFDSLLVNGTSGYVTAPVYLLGNIVRPHSNTYYGYETCERNLGDCGVTRNFRVSERGDNLLVANGNNIVDKYSMNVIEYLYTNDYTGYPYFFSENCIPEDEFVTSTIERGENATLTREFYENDGAVLEKVANGSYSNPVGNNLVVAQTVESFEDKLPILTKLKYENGSGYTYDSYIHNEWSFYNNAAFGKILYSTRELDYNTAVHGTKHKHGVNYTYDPDTGFVLSKSWHQDDNTRCYENYTYNSDKRLSYYVDVEGNVTSYTYEYTNGKVSKKISETLNDTGKTTVTETYTTDTGYAYPSVVTKTVTSGETTKTDNVYYTYNMISGTVKTKTDNEGNITFYEYDNMSRPTRIVHPEYHTYSTYSTKGTQILPVEDITYRSLERAYDGVILSNEKLIAQEIENTLSYYNVTGETLLNPSSRGIAEFPLTYYGSEVNHYLGTGEVIENNVLDTINGSSAWVKTSYYYDTDNNTVTVKDAAGNTTTTQYDGLGRQIKFADEFDNWYISEYNISGNSVGFKSLDYFVPQSDRSIKENITENTLDRWGRVISSKSFNTYPSDYSEIKYSYDYVGNVLSVTDANGNSATAVYDKLNRPLWSTNPLGETLSNVYDGAGNVKKQTIISKDLTESILYQRSYDGEGKIISDADNSGNSTSYTYDSRGRLDRKTDKDGKVYNTEYNSSGVCDREYVLKPEQTITDSQYIYRTPFGVSGVYSAKGTYDESVDGYSIYVNEISNTSYSESGKILTQNSQYAYSTGIGGVSFYPQVKYTYDTSGNVTSEVAGCIDSARQRVWAVGTNYTYDKSRLSKVQLNGNSAANTSDSVNALYEYYDDGKLKSVSLPLANGTALKSEYIYDGLSRLANLTNYKGSQILSSYSYTYDKNGNMLSSTEVVGGVTNTTSYTYDKLNRITSVSGTKGADSYYEYDMRGNRKANFEQNDYLIEENAEYRYDETDKLYYAEVGEDTTAVEYSSNGYRYVKRENTSYPEFYIYSPDGRLLGIAAPVNLTVNGETKVEMYPVKAYIWGSDRVLSQINTVTGARYYYLYNGHGDVVAITDTSGNIVNTYDYDVWGNFISKLETVDNPFTYFGQTYDETTGLYYLRARYYDPTTGRFTQQDPAEDGYNWYIYGNQNPVMFVDPLGLAPTAEEAAYISGRNVYV